MKSIIGKLSRGIRHIGFGALHHILIRGMGVLHLMTYDCHKNPPDLDPSPSKSFSNGIKLQKEGVVEFTRASKCLATWFSNIPFTRNLGRNLYLPLMNFAHIASYSIKNLHNHFATNDIFCLYVANSQAIFCYSPAYFVPSN